MPLTVLVTGATGNAGRDVLNELQRSPEFAVRAAVRNPAKLQTAHQVNAVTFSFEDQSTFEPALGGIDALFLIAPPMDPESDRKLAPVIAKARDLGVRHIVFNSSFGMENFDDAPLRKAERLVMESGVPWTILRPNFFMQNFSSGAGLEMIQRKGGIYLAAGEGRTSFISTVDIAKVVRVALERRLHGQAFSLTGPEALTHAEVAETISEAAGAPVMFVDLTEEQMLQGAREAGMPDHAVAYLALLYGLIRDGHTAEVTNEVSTLTGQTPQSFRDFARTHASAWRKADIPTY